MFSPIFQVIVGLGYPLAEHVGYRLTSVFSITDISLLSVENLGSKIQMDLIVRACGNELASKMLHIQFSFAFEQNSPVNFHTYTY